MSHTLTKHQLEKIGNTLIYLSDKVGEFNKTKILKLLFLLEESSIKKYGYPFFGVEFQLWKYGPVLKDVYIDLSEEEPLILKRYIKRVQNIFSPIASFNDDEFSNNDLELMDTIISFSKNLSASQLVNYTHDSNSLWSKSALAHGLLKDLESENLNSTDEIIDFSLLFEDNDFRKLRYESALENLQFINHLKN